MRPFWHPLSALLDPGLESFCSPALIRMPLQLGGAVELLYAGDRMWPAVGHGQRVALERHDPGRLETGDVVVAEGAGGPELARIVAIADTGLWLQGDADPGPPWRVEVGAVLGRAQLPRRRPGDGLRAWRRLRVDLAEAWLPAHLDGGGPADSVRRKYDAQAAHYAAQQEGLDEELLVRLREALEPGDRVVVAGSGSGRECLALARHGFRVKGLDFSAQMVARACDGARRAGLEVEYERADLRSHAEAPASVRAVLFTYDVYSFLPEPAERVEMLRGMRSWLASGGIVLLSARRVFRGYERLILTLQQLRSGGRWGGSHTRYVTADGKLHRSFVHYFTHSGLRREIEAAGLSPGPWRGGHVELSAG